MVDCTGSINGFLSTGQKCNSNRQSPEVDGIRLGKTVLESERLLPRSGTVLVADTGELILEELDICAPTRWSAIYHGVQDTERQ